MKEVVLFKVCKGLNDSTSRNAPAVNLENGETELRGCLNFTTTPDGRLETNPSMETLITVSDPTIQLFSGDKLFVQSDASLGYYTGTAITAILISSAFKDKAAFIPTPIDTRFSLASGSRYRIPAGSTTAAVLTVGSFYGPVTSKSYAEMPMFNAGFVHNSRLYGAYGKFLQYSENYAYDLWNLGDNFISYAKDIIQCGAIPGCVVVTHSDGITVHAGSGPHDFTKVHYPCVPIAGTLYSGTVTRLIAYAHVLLCDDGLYVIGQDGSVKNMTEDQFDNPGIWNSTWHSAVMQDGKYIAYGDQYAVEYNFKTKAVMLREVDAANSVAVRNGRLYAGTDSALLGESSLFTRNSTFALPFTDFDHSNRKKIHSLYVSGEFQGNTLFTVTNERGETDKREFKRFGVVRNQRIQGISQCYGKDLSVSLSTDGYCRVEEIRAIYVSLAGR